MKRTTVILGLVILLLLTAGVALAAVTAGYDLPWWTVDSAGGTSSGNGYTLNGTLGQPDAGMLSGGGYTLVGGFWGGSVTSYEVFLLLVLK